MSKKGKGERLNKNEEKTKVEKKKDKWKLNI